MYRRTLLAGLSMPLLGGCVDRYVSSKENTSREGGSSTTNPPKTATVAHEGPIDPAGGISRVRGDEDSVAIQLEGYDSSKFAETEFFRTTDSTGTPAELTRSQVTSTPQLQNALAYFGPEIETVTVSMPVSDGYSLTNALDSYWNADSDASKNEDEEEVYRFEDVRFTALTIFYD